MRMRKWLAALVGMAMLASCAAAEPAAMEEEPGYAPVEMTAEEIAGFVEKTFAAAAGTTAEAERELRKGLGEEETEARNAENAQYRKRTQPWLAAVFGGEIAEERPEELPQGEDLLTEEETEVNTEEATEEIVYTTIDSYEAFSEREPGRTYLELLAGMGGNSREESLLIAREICGMWIEQVDHEKLRELNGEYRCWIYSPGTQIDYPVVQSEDNSKYLKRMFNGARNSAGTLFIDYRNLPEFQDPNTLIYGHHMRNDSMFGTLTEYAQQAYYEEHPMMLVMTGSERFLVELFAGYTTTDGDHCYDIAISDEEDMAEFIDEAQRKTNFASGVEVKTTDRLVTLSTCAYAFKDARYIVLGRIIPIWNADMAQIEGAQAE